MAALNAATTPPPDWAYTNIGVSGTGASYNALNIASTLSGISTGHFAALINLGVNDFGQPSEPEYVWKNDMKKIIGLVHAKWPFAAIYLMRPWKSGFDAIADTFAGWIGNIITELPYVRLGPDERVWLKGADNGATNTVDGVHYNAAGETAAAAQWKTVLGY